MRVFVIGTGRCGTTTFAHACSHIKNYTSAHETPYQRHKLRFPDNHIEVSPHLSWVIGPLLKRNPNPCMLVHLRRNRDDVVRSWIRRGRMMGPGRWTPLSRVPQQSDKEWQEACELCYDSMTEQIQMAMHMAHQTGRMVATYSLEDAPGFWRSFWETIGAKGDIRSALAEWDRRYNASR